MTVLLSSCYSCALNAENVTVLLSSSHSCEPNAGYVTVLSSSPYSCALNAGHVTVQLSSSYSSALNPGHVTVQLSSSYSSALNAGHVNVSQPALGRVKCRYNAERLEAPMRENTFLFPFLIRVSAGDWWVVIGERRGRELSEFSFGVYGSPSGTLILGFLLGGSPWFGWPAGVEDCLESPWSQQKPGVCTDRNLFRLEDFKFRFGGCSPAYRASVLLLFLRSIVRADAGSRRTGERLVASCYIELV